MPRIEDVGADYVESEARQHQILTMQIGNLFHKDRLRDSS